MTSSNSRLSNNELVVFDLEWTSWPGFKESGWSFPGKYCEIIQIGAVKLSGCEELLEVDSFNRLVRPDRNPKLHAFIVTLTGITQLELDKDGVPFPRALEAFVEFIGSTQAGIVCNGADLGVIVENCDLHAISMPSILSQIYDFRPVLADLLETPSEQLVSADLPKMIGIKLDEPAHDALGDARALAAVLRHFRNQGLL